MMHVHVQNIFKTSGLDFYYMIKPGVDLFNHVCKKRLKRGQVPNESLDVFINH